MGNILKIRDIELSAITLPGGKAENEDCYEIRETEIGLLAIVCDGLGGPTAGKTASELAAKSIASYISGAKGDSDPLLILEDAAASANATIRDAAERNRTLKGMGSTCVCMLLQSDKAYIMNVGDSRCYLLRNDRAIFRTADHSYVGELVRKGAISEEMARTSEYANVLTHALGAGDSFETSTYSIDIRPGDRLALMTDGVWGAIPQDRLVRMLCADEDISELTDRIAYDIDSYAKENGICNDNLTLIITEMPGRVSSGIAYSAYGSLNESSEDLDHESDNPVSDENLINQDEEADYEITDGEDYETEDNDNLRKILIWTFSIGLVVALGVILYLTLWSSDGNRQTDSSEQSTALLSDSLVDSTADSTMIVDSAAAEPTVENSSVSTSAISSEPNAGATYSYNYNDYNSDEQSDNVADLEVAEPSGPDNTAAINCLNNAITKLETLKDYDPREIPKKDTRTRRKKRTEMFDGIVSSLKEAISSTEDASLKSEITQLGQDITAPSTKNNILKIDTETGKSTRASVTAIEGFISMMKALTE